MKKLLAIALLTVSINAVAVTPIATCNEISGYSYIPNQPQREKTWKEWLAEKIFKVTGVPLDWHTDGFSSGVVNLVQLPSGKLDVIIYNKARNETFSTLEDGGSVYLMRALEDDITIVISYPSFTSIYTFFKTDNNQAKVSVVESKNQFLFRTSMLTGNCSYYNFNKLRR